MNKKFDLYERALKFAIRVAKLIEKLPETVALKEYKRQLIKSSGSIGANVEEADGTLTKKDFVSKLGIARREARESGHWLRLIESVFVSSDLDMINEIQWQLRESKELMLILSSIINKTKDK